MPGKPMMIDPSMGASDMGASQTNYLDAELISVDDALASIRDAASQGMPKDPAQLESDMTALDDAVSKLKARVADWTSGGAPASPEVTALYQQANARGKGKAQ